MIIGLIGKANVGKSTFFNAATELAVPAANYPFTTVNPNVGVAFVRTNCICREFGVQDNPIHSLCIDGVRFAPVKLIDVAGLVPGAHAGKGLGNKFLDDARQADVLIHVVDASGSTDANGKPVPHGSGDPMFDINFVEEEFELWLASIVSRDWGKAVRDSESQGLKLEQMLTKRLSGLSISEPTIAAAVHASGLAMKKPILWDEHDIRSFCAVLRKRAKPFIVAANKADLPTSDNNIEKMRSNGLTVIPCASEAESLLRKASKKGVLHYLPGDSSFSLSKEGSSSLNEAQRRALEIVMAILKKFGSTGVQQAINSAVLETLNMIAVYPVEDEARLSDKKGNVLPDVRLLPAGSTAKQLAESVHAELAKGFLYAIDARTKQRVGADHPLKDRDVIKIVSATSRG